MNYPSIRIEGAILSADVFERIEDLPGQRAIDFGFDSSAKVKDEIARAWADAQDYWRIFQRKLETIKSNAPATTETRQQWVTPLLGLLGYQLEYQARGAELSGKSYAISHRATNRANAPIHILGYGEPAGLDRKPELSSSRMSAHALVQEFLNLNEQLYALVTNGRILRLLRDSSRLIKLSYLEFDLDRIFTDGLFADFAMLYRLLHATRMPVTNDTASESLIERYHQDSIEQGTRIREGLRVAVTQALEILGTGFISHPDNRLLCEQIEVGNLSNTAFFNHLLRLVYRLLFLSVVEERGLIFPKGTPASQVQVYFSYYSVRRLRRLGRTRGLKTERYHDAWSALLSTFQLFERPDQAAILGTTAFNGQLFDSQSLGPLNSCRLSNAALLNAIDRLCSFDDPKTHQRLPVNFGALATEEFGSVYESLLELHPVIDITSPARFSFKTAGGNERKTSGSYYTRSTLVDCLLDSALDPIINDRIRNSKALGYSSAEDAILSLKVCDPACGSGHFLIAAAQRIARRLALVRSNDEEPSPDGVRHALRQVVSRCIYAVDINPMSVELCRVALWLEGVEPGKPLSFLDHHVRVGNSLLGATPELIAQGIPDQAFTAIEGDDKKACAVLKKRNKAQRSHSTGPLFAVQAAETQARFEQAAAALEALPDDRPEAILVKELAFRRNEQAEDYRDKKRLADSWCASFVILKRFIEPGRESSASGIIQGLLNGMAEGRPLSPDVQAEVERLSHQYQFFHWHLAFPEVFSKGGFDCVLGNPPWERVKLQEKEWFAERSPEIANAPSAAVRHRLIEALIAADPALHKQFVDDSREAEGESHFMRNSGCYPLCGRGDINTYAVFAERMRNLLGAGGRVGCVLPSGIATDDTTKFFFQDVVDRKSLVSLFDFENRAGLFPDVHSSMKFCLFTSGRGVFPTAAAAEFVFFAHAVEDLRDLDRRFPLSVEEIVRLNPNTRTCPIFRSGRDAELTKAIYRRLPVLIREASDARSEENPWGVSFSRMFDMANDSHLFRTREQLEAEGWRLEGNIFHKDAAQYLPLYEAKMAGLYDHRAARVVISKTAMIRQGQPEELSLEEHDDPACLPSARVWINRIDVKEKIPPKWKHSFLLGWRRVSAVTNERTVLASTLPLAAAGDSLFLLFPNVEPAAAIIGLIANLSQIPFDFVARQKMGGVNVSYFIFNQLPILPPTIYAQPCRWSLGTQTLQHWLLPRVLELTYTAWDLESFARDCEFSGPPFHWNEERRFLLRCELDAAFFHLYLPADGSGNWLRHHGETEEDLERLKVTFPKPRDAVAYIMDTFPILKRKDESSTGEFRTKRIILEIYDALANAIRTGEAFQTLLNPPPADVRCCHSARTDEG